MDTSGHAKALRKNMTDPEQKLWLHLHDRQLAGFKFRRQCHLGPYIADFVCFEAKLVIEVDGGHHSQRSEADGKRSDWLANSGFRVLRFWNNEVLQKTHDVLERIRASLSP